MQSKFAGKEGSASIETCAEVSQPGAVRDLKLSVISEGKKVPVGYAGRSAVSGTVLVETECNRPSSTNSDRNLRSSP